MLKVQSDPSGADLYLDGVLKGTTPVDELVAKRGSHTLLVHLDGYQNWSTTTEVPAGEVRIIPTIKLWKE
ncbi:MAG: PEGA domain-containing protein [Methanospirillum sp.]|nr:PEGA domain-containing protein [Methanospirillum sp.]